MWYPNDPVMKNQYRIIARFIDNNTFEKNENLAEQFECQLCTV